MLSFRQISDVGRNLDEMPFGGLADFGGPNFYPRRLEWIVAVAFDTVGLTPHISCVMNHEAEGTDDTITNGELIAVCKIQMARMKQVRLQGNEVFPVRRINSLPLAIWMKS